MKRGIVPGVLTSLAGVALVVWWLSYGTHLPVYRWPAEAFQGLAFFLAWGLGVPEALAYLLAGLAFPAVLIVCFFPGYWAARCLVKRR
ncbi:hypothetical protein [Halomonas marinisediminis]|uniref:Uncharacterized protein n=1 Tax=Halomonas marinisediminis TaxID=2546095 RepID=A0ABY2D7E6_9GAMM|nr:hypothetical protein [Halomonas marinisediminis]TDB02968.1 hypothetical protein E0702_08090 [Halomonas marinisediminis]